MPEQPDQTASLLQLTIPQLLQMRAKSQGDAVALRRKTADVWSEISWNTYFRTSRELAAGLTGLGFQAGDRLAIAGDNGPEWLYMDLAAQMLGGSCLGVYPTSPWPELQYIVRHSKAKILVCIDPRQTANALDACRLDDGLPDLTAIVTVSGECVAPAGKLALSFGRLRARGALDERLGAHVEAMIRSGDPEDVAVICYTSGTTGMPKGVMLPHRSLIRSAFNMARLHGLDSTHSVLCYLPLCHGAERSFSAVMQLLTGGVVNFAESIDAMGRNLREVRPTTLFGVPRIWQKFQQTVTGHVATMRPLKRRAFGFALRLGRGVARRRLEVGGGFAHPGDRVLFQVLNRICFRHLRALLGLQQLRVGLCGGATIAAELPLFFIGIGIPVYQIYGLTETGGASHSQRRGAMQSGSTGLPIGDIAQKLAPDGELLLRGASLFKGYLFDDAATRRAFEDGWLRTGDIVEIGRAGEIYVVDRKKDILITSGGKNITPSRIELALKGSPYISEAVLLGEGRHYLSALIQIDEDAVAEWIREKGRPVADFWTMTQDRDVRALIEAEVARVNERFARVENVRKFALITKKLSHADGDLTATMKLRRASIEKNFSAEIEGIYGQDTKQLPETEMGGER
jgi:long-chain acyl-CoA synthetase